MILICMAFIVLLNYLFWLAISCQKDCTSFEGAVLQIWLTFDINLLRHTSNIRNQLLSFSINIRRKDQHKKNTYFYQMWCCGSTKKQQKKPLKNAKQQPIKKTMLTLSSNISFELKGTQWIGKINKAALMQRERSEQKQQAEEDQDSREDEQQLSSIEKLKNEIGESEKQKLQKQSTIFQLQIRNSELEQKRKKAKAVQKVLQYLIVTTEQNINSYALKIKT